MQERSWLFWAVALFVVAGVFLIVGFAAPYDSSAPYSCYEDPTCDVYDPANATPRPFPTGWVVLSSITSVAGGACLWIWIISKGVEAGRKTAFRRPG